MSRQHSVTYLHVFCFLSLDLDCFDFSSKKFSNAVGELNPMLEFMPHTKNGAPFTLSHNPNSAISLPQEQTSWSDSQYKSYYHPYFNSDETDREPNYNFASPNKDVAYSRPIFSTEDKMTQTNHRISVNHVNSDVQTATTARNEMYPWQGVAKPERVTNNFVNPYEPSQERFSYISSTKRRQHGRKLTQRKKKQNRKNKFLNKRKYAKRKFHKNLERHFKKAKTKSKHDLSKNAPYRSSHRKHSRIQRIFNFKSVRRKKTKRKQKLRDKNRNKLGWQKSSDVNEILRRNYEEIVNLLFDAFKIVHKKSYSSHHDHETRKDIYRHNLR